MCLTTRLTRRRCHHLVIRMLFLDQMEGRADAVPTTRNYTPDSPDLDERRGQPLRSAMARSRPGGTALLIMVTSAPSKFNDGATIQIKYGPLDHEDDFSSIA